MSPTLEVALILILVAMLVIASAVAGALWWRLRSLAPGELARLADHVRALESLLGRLKTESDSAPAVRIKIPAGPRTNRRVDRTASSAVAGPTLITVPDLSSSPGEAAMASAALGRRFGAIWALADSGASAEAIARGTGQPIGQVELILGLRRQLEAATSGGQSA